MRDNKHEVLRRYFGYNKFREGQEDVIDNLLSGRDVLAVMPTGAGKSVCYQVPALMLEGIALVISPLISLMKDQVNALKQAGVGAAYINSSMNADEFTDTVRGIYSGLYKIIYVAPERLASERFVKMCQKLEISMVAVDESHCVSQWGQDFRPGYLNISGFIEELNSRPVVAAFTATATSVVKADICRILKLHDPFELTTGFDRPNLRFSVITSDDRKARLLSLVKEREAVSGIIYCATRKNVEDVYDELISEGVSATLYHAGLRERERTANQDSFVNDRALVMVATNAFGMGIDKSNVSYIIHYNMPKDIESYYQEAGRAGRDGEEAECILMYSPADVELHKFMIKNSEPNELLSWEEQKRVKNNDFERLKHMTYYCTTSDCLRGYILRYFGEKSVSGCGKCSNCITPYEKADITIEAQKVMSCVARMGQRFGLTMVIAVLRGSRNKRVYEFGFDKLSTYGIMSDCSESRIRQIANVLVQRGYLAVSGGEYPVLKLTQKSMPVLKGKETVTARFPAERGKVYAKAAAEPADIDAALLDRLKTLRKKLAQTAGVPAYVIFTDAALTDMCRKKPKTTREFLEISGVGRVKCERYGEKFMKEIAESED